MCAMGASMNDTVCQPTYRPNQQQGPCTAPQCIESMSTGVTTCWALTCTPLMKAGSVDSCMCRATPWKRPSCTWASTTALLALQEARSAALHQARNVTTSLPGQEYACDDGNTGNQPHVTRRSWLRRPWGLFDVLGIGVQVCMQHC